MQYITDKDKNITHVIVPIDEWNTLFQSRNKDEIINPYQSVLDWIEDRIIERSENGSLPSFAGEIKAGQTVALPAYHMLKETLQNNVSAFGSNEGETMFGGFGKILSEMYSFALSASTVDIAVAYILRNDAFYTALSHTKTQISVSDEKVLLDYGFNIHSFKKNADSALLDILYGNNKSEFAFIAMRYNIVDYFSLLPAKKRMRREPEILRLFFFDIFEVQDEILKKEPSFVKVFDKYPLVDKLAQVIYPDNTLSGATSRVYKATKEAKTIISSNIKSYVFILTPKTAV